MLMSYLKDACYCVVRVVEWFRGASNDSYQPMKHFGFKGPEANEDGTSKRDGAVVDALPKTDTTAASRLILISCTHLNLI